LQAQFLTQFRVRQLLVLYFFVLQQRVPVLSPVVRFVQYLSVPEFTMYFQSHWDLQTPSTSFTPLLRHCVSLKSQQQLQHVVAYR
jgi:hypothetical protein